MDNLGLVLLDFQVYDLVLYTLGAEQAWQKPVNHKSLSALASLSVFCFPLADL